MTENTLITSNSNEEDGNEDPKKLLQDLLAPTICQTARCYKYKKCIECIPSNMTTKERQDKEKKEENFTLRHHINIVNNKREQRQF